MGRWGGRGTAIPRSMTIVRSEKMDMLVYISLSMSQNARVLSPTRLYIVRIKCRREEEYA